MVVCNTGTYELTKEVFNHYYSNVSTKFGIKEITDIFDRERAKVGDKLKIYNRNAKREVGRISKFTINQFHTTCRFHINGSYHGTFIEQDLPEIVDILRRKLPAAAKLNEQFRVLLETYNCEKTKSTRSPRLQKSTSIPSAKSRSINVSLNSSCSGKTSDDLDTYSCPFCTDADLTDMIECCECGSWIHFSCAGLDTKRKRDHYAKYDVIYRCSVCIAMEDDDTPVQASDSEIRADTANSEVHGSFASVSSAQTTVAENDTGVQPRSSPLVDLDVHAAEEPLCGRAIQPNSDQVSGDMSHKESSLSQKGIINAGARRKDNAMPVNEIPLRSHKDSSLSQKGNINAGARRKDNAMPVNEIPLMKCREQSLVNNRDMTNISASHTAGADVQPLSNTTPSVASHNAVNQAQGGYQCY